MCIYIYVYMSILYVYTHTHRKGLDLQGSFPHAHAERGFDRNSTIMQQTLCSIHRGLLQPHSRRFHAEGNEGGIRQNVLCKQSVQPTGLASN